MKLLEKIKIGGHWYTVKFPYVFREVDSGGNVRADSAILADLIHEIFHAIDRNTGHEVFVGEAGEKRCTAISEGWFQVLRDNRLDFRNSD